jgi:hypothetical protein
MTTTQPEIDDFARPPRRSGVSRRTTFVTQPPAEIDPLTGTGDPQLEAVFDSAVAQSAATMQVLDGDDLFTAPRPRIELPILHPITCAVCGLTSKIAIGVPGDVCGPCRVDLLQTQQHVEMTLEAARSRLHVLMSNFEAAVARENEADQARWQRVAEARVKVQAGAVSAASFRARWAEALAVGDGLGRILVAHEAYERGCQDVERVEQWTARASEELSLC